MYSFAEFGKSVAVGNVADNTFVKREVIRTVGDDVEVDRTVTKQAGDTDEGGFIRNAKDRTPPLIGHNPGLRNRAALTLGYGGEL